MEDKITYFGSLFTPVTLELGYLLVNHTEVKVPKKYQKLQMQKRNAFTSAITQQQLNIEDVY